jgi:hypothetical protein
MSLMRATFDRDAGWLRSDHERGQDGLHDHGGATRGANGECKVAPVQCAGLKGELCAANGGASDLSVADALGCHDSGEVLTHEARLVAALANVGDCERDAQRSGKGK